MLEITVHKINGFCPVYNKGDKIVVDGAEICLDKTDALCTHALSSLLHYTTLLEHDFNPLKFGLTTEDEPHYAYLHCLDPGKPFTDGGTVLFRIEKKEP